MSKVKDKNQANKSTMKTESYYDTHKEVILIKMKTQYEFDHEFREKVLSSSKKRYHSDPEYREKTIQRAKERYRKLRKAK